MGDVLMSYASGASAAPLLGETIGENLERAAARYPGREALVDVAAGRRWTYAELDAAVNEVALGLLAMGIAKGDRVGIWAPNCAEWVLTQYATAKIGAVLVNVNPAYRAYELDYVVRQSGMRLMVSAVAHRGSDYRAMLAEIGFEQAVFIGEPELGRAAGGRAPGRPRGAGRTGGRPGLRRPDQHPVHLRDHRLPQGRHAVAPQHPEQRLFRR